ncbi:DNA/RNA non-specific endonuclease [Luteimonas notoginsengisoli]|uniref:DNA/RNA non-specific endonuclease n=1 Tax=Luteimonas notoginsengisoli TaxID=1578200 RepID=A0ABV7UTT4_9GAMM
MFDPVRDCTPHAAPCARSSIALQADPAVTDGPGISRLLRESPCVERPALARSLVDALDDDALAALAAPAQRDVLQALDEALAEAPVMLEVAPQRERLADALRATDDNDDPAPQGHAGADGISTTTARIGENTVTWTNDAEGRPIRAEADLSEVFSGIDRGSAETRAQRESADRGIDGDQGGHLIGHRFVKDQGLKNLFPQNGNFNVSAYKKLENEWADWIDSGKDVHITVQLTPVNQDRPERVRVSYEVTDPADGRVVYDQRVTFRNEAGQQFDRVPRADMADA